MKAPFLLIYLCLFAFGCTNGSDDVSGEPKSATSCLQGVPCAADSDCVGLPGTRCNTALENPQCQKIHCGGRGTICDEDALCESRECGGKICLSAEVVENGKACFASTECQPESDCVDGKCEMRESGLMSDQVACMKWATHIESLPCVEGNLHIDGLPPRERCENPPEDSCFFRCWIEQYKCVDGEFDQGDISVCSSCK